MNIIKYKKNILLIILTLILLFLLFKKYIDIKENKISNLYRDIKHKPEFQIYKKKKVSQIFGLNIYQNNLYAASTFHNRIVKFDLEGNYLNFMNYYGNFEKTFQNVSENAIFENNNKLVGKMTNVHSIDFDKSGNMYISQYIANEGSNKGFTFVPKKCFGICTAKDIKIFSGFKGVSHSLFDIQRENLLVADYGDGEELKGDIYVFNVNDLGSRKKLSLISNHKFKKPHMIRHYKSNYYVIDVAKKEIVVMDINYNVVKIVDNNFLKKKNNLETVFKTITAITFSDKFIFVSDVGTHSILAFDYEWNLKFKISENIYTHFDYNENSKKIKKSSTSLLDLKLNSPFDIFYNKNKLYIANTHSDELIVLKFNKS